MCTCCLRCVHTRRDGDTPRARPPVARPQGRGGSDPVPDRDRSTPHKESRNHTQRTQELPPPPSSSERLQRHERDFGSARNCRQGSTRRPAGPTRAPRAKAAQSGKQKSNGLRRNATPQLPQHRAEASERTQAHTHMLSMRNQQHEGHGMAAGNAHGNVDPQTLWAWGQPDVCQSWQNQTRGALGRSRRPLLAMLILHRKNLTNAT